MRVLAEHDLTGCENKVRELKDDLESTGSARFLAVARGRCSDTAGCSFFNEFPDSPTTWWIKPNTVGHGFRELGKYCIRKPVGTDRLLIDDEAVETDNGEWVWSPGFYAGQVRAEMLGPDGRVRATYLLDVSPNPDKFGARFVSADAPPDLGVRSQSSVGHGTS